MAILAAACFGQACAETRLYVPRNTAQLVIDGHCFDCKPVRLQTVEVVTYGGQVSRAGNLRLWPNEVALYDRRTFAVRMVPRHDIDYIAVVDRRDAVARGAIWGGVVGALGGMASMLAWRIAQDRQQNGLDYIAWPALGALGGVAGGTSLGALLGLPFGRTYVFDVQP